MKKTIQLFCILTIIFFSSCHALVEDEFPNFSSQPVLNGLLEADSTFRVQVSISANLSDSSPKYVDNARVIIESIQNAPDTLSYSEKGWYVSPCKVLTGETYTCKVSIPGYNLMTAHTTVPVPTDFDSIVFTDVASRGEEGEKISAIEFRIQNNPAEKQFWEVQLITSGWREMYDFDLHDYVTVFKTEEKYIYMLAGRDSVLLNEPNPLTVFSNKKINNNSYTAKFYLNERYNNFSRDETPYIQLKTVDASYYNYIKQYYLYEMAGGVDIGKGSQKYPLYSNVTNGQGVFMGISVTRKRVILPEEE